MRICVRVRCSMPTTTFAPCSAPKPSLTTPPHATPPLARWPLFRDCTYYIIGLLVLTVFVYDGKVELYEAIILFAL